MGRFEIKQRQTDLPHVAETARAPRRSRADCTAGNNSPTRRPMMAITTSSSINVKPANEVDAAKRPGGTVQIHGHSDTKWADLSLCLPCEEAAMKSPQGWIMDRAHDPDEFLQPNPLGAVLRAMRGGTTVVTGRRVRPMGLRRRCQITSSILCSERVRYNRRKDPVSCAVSG